MGKNEAINAIKEIKETTNASDELIEICISMADKMIVIPSVRPIVDDEYFGSGVAFDYDDENGFVVEIFVSDEEIWGYTSYLDDEISNFAFENKNDAINFWNVIIRRFA